MAAKRKAPAKAPTKPRTLAPKEKPANMSREEWNKEMERHSFIMADRRRRRIAAMDAAKAASTAEACLSLGSGLSNISNSPSSPGYYTGYNADGSSISQMRLSQMDGRARYSPEYADNDMTFDPNALFSPDSAARGSGAFRFPRRPELVA